MPYNPQDWYWIVAGSTTEVWSSKRVQYVAVNDATYTAWLAAGGVPTKISSALELIGVLQIQWQPVYLAATGVAIQSTGTPALNGNYAIDVSAKADIDGIYAGIKGGDGLPGGGATFEYFDKDGGSHAFDAASFSNFAKAVRDYFYNFAQGLMGLVNQVSGAAMPSSTTTIP